MPIYAYRCENCGHAKDVLQKVSDPVLVVCPACGEPTFKKQVTAAGFQLKGSGWYVTDFRGDGKPKAGAEAAGGASSKEGADKPSTSTEPTKSDAAPAAPGPAPASDKSAAPAASPAPAPSTGPAGGKPA